MPGGTPERSEHEQGVRIADDQHTRKRNQKDARDRPALAVILPAAASNGGRLHSGHLTMLSFATSRQSHGRHALRTSIHSSHWQEDDMSASVRFCRALIAGAMVLA